MIASQTHSIFSSSLKVKTGYKNCYLFHAFPIPIWCRKSAAIHISSQSKCCGCQKIFLGLCPQGSSCNSFSQYYPSQQSGLGCLFQSVSKISVHPPPHNYPVQPVSTQELLPLDPKQIMFEQTMAFPVN